MKIMEKYNIVLPENIEKRITFKTFQAGETIISQGDKSVGVYVLIDGVVKVMCASPTGTVYVTHYMEATGFFGDVEAITELPVSNSIVAKTTCKVIGMDRETFFLWLKQDWSFSRFYIETSAKRLTDTDERAKRRYSNTVDENILQIIRTKVEEGINAFDKFLIEREVFSTQRSINRSLKKLSDEGAICVKKGVVYIKDTNKLQSNCKTEK